MHNIFSFNLLAKSLFWFLFFLFLIASTKARGPIFCKINCKAHAHKYAFLGVVVGIGGVEVAQNYVELKDMLIVVDGRGLFGLSGRGLPEFVVVVVEFVVVVVDFSAVALYVVDA